MYDSSARVQQASTKLELMVPVAVEKRPNRRLVNSGLISHSYKLKRMTLSEMDDLLRYIPVVRGRWSWFTSNFEVIW